ncbi:MAG: hypothetical protein AMXMBFR47_22850 [Planctomycetota bacterium]
MPRRVDKGVCGVSLFHADGVRAAHASLSSDGELQVAAEAFQVLAHPSRLRVLQALQNRELCVCDLSAVLGLSMPATSQTLRELRNLGAVKYRTAGKLAIYSLADAFWAVLLERTLKRLNRVSRNATGRTRVSPARATG